MQCDLLVLGESPEGWAAAEDAARAGAKTIVIRPQRDVNPAAGLMAAVRAACEEGSDPPVFQKTTCGPVSPAELCRAAIEAYERRISWRRRELGIHVRRGRVRLSGPAAVRVYAHGSATTVTAQLVVIATGTVARRSREWTVGHERANLADGRVGPAWLLPEETATCQAAPEKLIVLGGDRTATAFARLFAVAGSEVTLIDAPQRAAGRLVEGANDGLASSWPVSRIFDEIVVCRVRSGRVTARTAGGTTVTGELILFAARRDGATGLLGLPDAGLEADNRGRLWCDDQAMTWVPTIAAAGEVLGYPDAVRYDRQRIQQTIAAKLGLSEPREAPVMSIRIDQPPERSGEITAAASTPASATTQSRSRRRPRARLRLFGDSRRDA